MQPQNLNFQPQKIPGRQRKAELDPCGNLLQFEPKFGVYSIKVPVQSRSCGIAPLFSACFSGRMEEKLSQSGAITFLMDKLISLSCQAEWVLSLK